MSKHRVVIFGAGGTGQKVYHMIEKDVDVIYFVDNDPQKMGGIMRGFL